MSEPVSIATERHRFKMETMICKFMRQRPRAMYDIGVGPKAEYLHLKNQYPNMRLYGCEPDPVQFPDLKEKFPGKLWNVAIAREAGTVLLHQPGDCKQSSLFEIRKGVKTVEVEAWTLDQFDEKAKKQTGVLLWMDIEGSELAALQSGPNLLTSGRVKWINLEVRDVPLVEGWPTAAQIGRFLWECGYTPIKEYNNQKTHRDVIYALDPRRRNR